MLKFTHIRYKNFLSTGNNFIEFPLCENKRTLIVGENGAGKSTMICALCFALFGKPYRNINKNQIINSINEKECLVECEFSIGKTKYKVVRGIKPNIFEIYKNGKLIEQDAKARDYQDYLEKNILNLNYKTFTQICVLGSTNYKPFMTLTAQERRDIIEDILDIQVFSKMSTLVKSKLSNLRNEMFEIKSDIDKKKTEISLKNDYISSINQKDADIIETNKEQLKTFKEKAKTVLGELETLNKKMEKYNNIGEKINSIKAEEKKYREMHIKLESFYNELKKNTDRLETMNDCPVCLQKISEEHKNEHIEKNTNKMEVLKKGIDDILSTIQDISERLNSALNEQLEMTSISGQIAVKNSEIALLFEQTETLKTQIEEANKMIEKGTEKDMKELAELESKLAVLENEYSEMNKENEIYSVSEKLLKDNGIKTKIIADYIPLINKNINNYLKELDFFVGFNLDENFKETIKSRHRDEFSYQSFSEGQKFRINIAILLTWREIAKSKNSVNTNLLILDEVFDSSLDTSGVNDFTKLLNALSHDDTNIFVISHRGESMLDKFDNVLEFSLQRDFTVMKEVV